MSIPNPMTVISRNVAASTSDDCFTSSPASYANDGNYDLLYRSCNNAPSSGTPVTLTYDISGVPSGQRGNVVSIWYNDPKTGAYQPGLISANPNNIPGDYTIQCNTAAGGGSAPSSGWVTLQTVATNRLHSRQVALNLTSYNWIRMSFTASYGSGGNSDIGVNWDVHDASGGNQDNFIAYGDSITQRGFDHSSMGNGSVAGAGNITQLINAVKSTHFPIIECGGIGGDLSSNGAAQVPGWLAYFTGKYVLLNYGTNDANNASPGDVNVANTFYTNMVTMVTAVISAGKIPIIPKIPWAQTANVQSNGPGLNAKIALLYAAYPSIIPGPDLWTYFFNNQSLITANDVHPTDPLVTGSMLTMGYPSYRQQWANWFVSTVYTATATTVADVVARSSRHHRVSVY